MGPNPDWNPALSLIVPLWTLPRWSSGILLFAEMFDVLPNVPCSVEDEDNKQHQANDEYDNVHKQKHRAIGPAKGHWGDVCSNLCF